MLEDIGKCRHVLAGARNYRQMATFSTRAADLRTKWSHSSEPRKEVNRQLKMIADTGSIGLGQRFSEIVQLANKNRDFQGKVPATDAAKGLCSCTPVT